MAVLMPALTASPPNTATMIAPAFWSVNPAGLGRLGRRLWPHLLCGFVPSPQWGLQDIKGNPALRLALAGGAAIDFRGLVTNGNGHKASITTPEYLKRAWPQTLIWIGYKLGARSANVTCFGTTYDNAGGSPFVGLQMGENSGGTNIQGNANFAGTFNFSGGIGADYPSTPGLVIVSGQAQVSPLTLYHVIAATAPNVFASSGGNAGASPSYASTSLLIIGDENGSRNPNMVTMAAYWLQGYTLNAADSSDLIADPFALVRPEVWADEFVRAGTATSTARSFVAGMIG